MTLSADSRFDDSNNPLIDVPAGSFEMVGRLAASLLDAPVALIARRNLEGSWANEGVGFPAEWRHRELPDAAVAINSAGLFVRRYASDEHPLAGVRFCAAIPFHSGGMSSVVMIFDHRLRDLSVDEIAALESVAALAADAAREAVPLPNGSEPEIAFTLDLSGNFTAANAALEHFGFVRKQLLGTPFLNLVPHDRRDEAQDWLFSQIGGGTRDFDLPLETPQGELLLACRPRLLFENGHAVGIEAACRDISTPAALHDLRRQTERELEAKATQLAAFSAHLRELHRLSVTERTSIANLYRDYLTTGCAIFKLPTGRVLTPDGTVVATVPTGVEGPFVSILSSALSSAGQPLGTLEFGGAEDIALTPSAHDRDVLELMAQALGHAIYTGRLENERAQLTNYLAHQLRHDPLTGLPNRLGVVEYLERTIGGEGSPSPLAVLFLDLDQFKQINDTLGHSAGDELLRQVAARLADELEPGDVAARIGGDEFTFLIAGEPSEDELAARVRILLGCLREPYVIDDIELFITASIGISLCPRDGSDPKILMQRADSAMYRVKQHGKNDFEFYRTETAARASNRLELETQLRRAIDNGELDMRFQPILDLDRTLESLEVLLSWQNAKFGNVGPARFIPIAEESGMIISIGRWVLHQACKQNMEWAKAGYVPARIAVNVSALQFSRSDFYGMVANVLEETGMPPQCLELELTESLVMKDLEESARRMDRLRDLGIGLSIDDFGTGYSSLSYLRRLPVDTLKIDRSFLTELTSSATSLPLIQTIVVLAHNMGLSVVAEGVETEEQFAVLKAIGCDRVQGHLFGEALRAPGVPALLRRASPLPR